MKPITADGDRLDAVLSRIREWHTSQEALHPYIAQRRAELLQKRLEDLALDADDLEKRLSAVDEHLRDKRSQAEAITRDIDANGGARLKEIEVELSRQDAEKQRRRQKLEEYSGLARVLDLATPLDAEGFLANRRALREQNRIWAEKQVELERELANLNGDERVERLKLDPLAKEIASLRKRRNNIPGAQIDIRERLCAALSIRENEVPFVGELLQIREDAREWEGAIERLLHGFGLSLLVADHLYPRVAAWVDQTHLAGRLVYFRVRESLVLTAQVSKARTVPTKLTVKPDAPYTTWLANELAHRFNYVCCETLEDFRREPFALTRAGQVKGARDRHEKDDRYRLNDRQRYVLGWDNAGKLKALERERDQVETQARVIAEKIRQCRLEVRHASERRSAIHDLERFSNFSEIDWGSTARDLEALTREREMLESGSDILRTLKARLDFVYQDIERLDKDRTQLVLQKGANRDRQGRDQAELKRAMEVVQAMVSTVREEQFQKIRAMHQAKFPEAETVEECLELEQVMQKWLRDQLERDGRRETKLSGDIVKAMSQFASEFPRDTQDMDVSVQALSEYRALMQRIDGDDLPRFEARFKKLLNENTIRGIVQLQAQIVRQRDLMRERLEQINRSLKGLDYNPGRYIRLHADPSPDREIKEFQLQLRACVEDTLTGSSGDQYSEAKFLQVKAIVERFRGRPGYSEVDRRWTDKVTDVRNEFVFSASERWREDDAEHEHYTDSGGKSGGQKEKLAYTILAASLAYQFGLDSGSARSFRFVVIDEAFGRGSDESAQFGLELFQHLGLQLLIVTPLQKIHIIEPYVANVGFVHNENGQNSQLRNITIEEYRAEIEARRS